MRPPKALLSRLGPMLKPAGDAAEAGGQRVRRAEAHQQPVAVDLRLAAAARGAWRTAARRSRRRWRAPSAPPTIVGRSASEARRCAPARANCGKFGSLYELNGALPMVGPSWLPSPARPSRRSRGSVPAARPTSNAGTFGRQRLACSIATMVSDRDQQAERPGVVHVFQRLDERWCSCRSRRGCRAAPASAAAPRRSGSRTSPAAG